jgi:hypothetical protein
MCLLEKLYRIKNILINMISLLKVEINNIKRALRWLFSGFSITFIGILLFVVIHDSLTGLSSTTIDYCEKYSFFISPSCW